MDFLLQIIELTGLPKDLVEKEMLAMIRERGLDKDNLTNEQVREVLSLYLQDTLVGLKKDIET